MPPAADRDDSRGVYAGLPVLVTGGAGFIGSHLARRLVDLGAHVRVLDDLSTGSLANLEGLPIDFREASILDEEALGAAIEGCRLVFHQGAMVSVPLSVEEPERCFQINVTGTEHLLEAARDAGVQRVVFASSAAVYGGAPALPSREDHLPDPCSPYAASKITGEHLMTAFARCWDLSTVSLRYFNIFGPRQDPDSPYAAVISAFTKALAAGRMPVILGDGRQTRDFTFVENVVHANLLAGSSPHDLRGEAINIGTGQATNLLDLAARMADLLNVTGEPTFAPPRPGDVRDSLADITRARERLGYEPQVDLAAGLARTIGKAGQSPILGAGAGSTNKGKKSK